MTDEQADALEHILSALGDSLDRLERAIDGATPAPRTVRERLAELEGEREPAPASSLAESPGES